MSRYVAGRTVWLFDRFYQTGEPVPDEVTTLLDIPQSIRVGALEAAPPADAPEPTPEPVPVAEAAPEVPTAEEEPRED